MGAAGSVASIALDLFASLLAPPRCAACDAPVGRRVVFCAACASTAEPAASEGPGDLAAFVYGGAVAAAIVRMKYGARPDLARPLADLLWRAAGPHATALADAVVVPVPLHAARLAERGFNQSALLGRSLSTRLGARFAPLALARTRDTPAQAGLPRSERLENLSGAFRVRAARAVAGRSVLLVDDVRTTGATLEACASVLRAAGATAVVTAVIARTPPAR